DGVTTMPARLSPRNRAHLRFVERQTAAFPEACRRVLRRWAPPDRVPILVNRVANELLTMSVTLSRAATLTSEGGADVQGLADVYCSAARHRLADWWRQALDADEPDYRRVAVNWLGDARPELMPETV